MASAYFPLLPNLHFRYGFSNIKKMVIEDSSAKVLFGAPGGCPRDLAPDCRPHLLFLPVYSTLAIASSSLFSVLTGFSQDPSGLS